MTACLFAVICMLLAGCGSSEAEGTYTQEENSSQEQEGSSETAQDDNAETEGKKGKGESIFAAAADAGDDAGDGKTEALSETEIAEKLTAKLVNGAGVDNDDIRFFDINDFDGDGGYEGFALTGPEPDYDFYEDGLLEGSIYFVNDDTCEKLADSNGMGFVLNDRILDFGSRKYILFNDAYATGILTYAFEVNGSKASETAFSRLGEVAEPDDTDLFRIVDSSYDAEYDPEIDGYVGHTWKSYYFHYDIETDSVREYGAVEVSNEKAAKLCGHDLVAECLEDGDTLEGIYNRANGLYHINYSSTDQNGMVDYYHRTWDNLQGCYINDLYEKSDEECSGKYLTELCPDIADYPDI